ncbi:MAG: DUF4175 domain-containing protein, partial [Kiritimatiellae bacterium]|nr:DUF4175 domain-containing protein [Kiritimatiellia bacterium]
TYTGLPPLTREGLPGDIVAVAGTKVTLTAGFNAKLSVAALVVNGKEITASSDLSHSRSSRKQWSLVLEPGLEGTWSFRLRDEFGFENEPLEYRIQALPDRPPTISIIEPDRQNLRLRPTDRLPLAYVVNDDFGIGTVEMLADLQNNGEFKPFLSQLPFQEAEQKGEFVGQTVLDLGTVDLKGARTFKLQLRVRDTLPPEQNGPQLALSRPITINIDLSAPSLAEQELGLQQHHIARTLEEARKELVAARQDAQEAVGQIREKSEITEVAATKLESVRERSAGTEERLRQLAEAVRQSAYAQMADEIRAVPDRAIQPAREAAGMIPLAGNDGERGQYAQAMLQNLERAIGELNRLQDELKELRTRLAVAAAVADLAERQTELAREAAQLASAGAATIPQNWQAREQQVVGDLAPLVRGSQEALQSAFEDARERTGGLLAAARRLAAEQQRTAAAVQQLQGAAGNAEQFAETARQIATEFGSEPRDGVNPESVLAQHQEGLAREAGNLAEATRGLGEALRNLGQSEPLQQAARSSEQAFGNAQSRMNEAARSLASTAAARAQGQPLAEGERANLAAMQASASQAAQQAVGALENLERSLAAAMARLPEQTQPADEMLDGAELARALREASAAAQFAQSSARSTASSQSGQPHAATGQTGQAEPALRGQSTGQAAVHEAARAAQQAAAALQTAAAQAAGNTGVPMQNMAFHSDQQGTMLAFTHNPFSVSRGGFGSDPEAERRRPPPPEFGIAGSDWVKLKGALESEVAKAAADTVPKDYRELVKQYFRELSRRGVLRARKE